MKKQLITIALILLALIPSINAQNKQLLFDIDYARFAHDDSSGFFELYYVIYQSAFTPFDDDGAQRVSGILSVHIQTLETEELLVQKSYNFAAFLDDSLQPKSLIGRLGYIIPFGQYMATVVCKDSLEGGRIDSAKFTFEIIEKPPEKFSVSDIELANSIIQVDQSNSVFYKNTYEVIPNPSALYGESLPVVYFYAELYNLDVNAGADVVRIDQKLIDGAGQERYQKHKYVNRRNSAIVEAGAINIVKIPSGAYTLLVAVSDTVNQLTNFSTKKLFIYNPNVIDTVETEVENLDFHSSEFASMGEEEVDEIFGMSKYIAANQEIERWEKLEELTGKQQFLFDFWKARDLTPETAKNEFKNDYFKRVEYANDRFGAFNKPGWKTDRGRVLLMYGEPSQIDRYPNQVDTKPYEIWRYDGLEGGVYFVFADMTGFSDYQLMHSTLRGELRDDNWEYRISSF